MKISIDAATESALMGKTINGAKQLLEDMASNNYLWVLPQERRKA